MRESGQGQVGGSANDAASADATDQSRLDLPFLIAVLVFGAVIGDGQFYYLRRHDALFSERAFKSLGLTLVVTALLFLVTGGISDERIGPALGLLGTVARYLLAKGSETKDR